MPTVELERPSATAAAGRHAVASACGHEPFDDLAALFPSRRPCSGAAAASARRAAHSFDPRASATAWLIGEGLERLDPKRRRGVVEHWGALQDEGLSVVTDGGCDVRLGRAGVGPAERAALLVWLPFCERDLAVYDGGLFEDAPAHAIALLVRPPTIWSLEEVACVERLFPRGRHFDPHRFAAIEQHAYPLISEAHEARLRRAVARIAAQLPMAAHPVASTTVASGCADVAADGATGRAVVARQLARYASSALVSGCVHAAA